MNPIATPAFRPTADCIWNSFRSSNKRHLLITGGRGSGKTTLLNALFPAQVPDIVTWAVPGQVVFMKENLSGKSAQIGVYDANLPGPENRMALCAAGFTSLGIPALQRCMDTQSEWATIDEIGYLESGHPAYCDAIRRLMDATRLAAAVRKQDVPFLQELTAREDVFWVDLDAPYANAGCVVMASGLGKRFGSNKLTAEFCGEPLICRALSATDGVFARRVVVTRHGDVAALCKERGIDVILHDLPHRSDTVRLGLEAVGNVDRCMFCQGDQPLLRQETVAAMLIAAANDPGPIWRARFQDTPGSPVLFPAWAFPELRSLPEGKGGGILIKRYPERLRTVSVRDEYELMDADTPEDLLLLSRR